MTGGGVVILGAVGKNFGAGMSGGEAYVLDESGELPLMMNAETIRLTTIADARDRALVARLLANHHRCTHSRRALDLLCNWPRAAHRFKKVVPIVTGFVARRRANSMLESTSAAPPSLVAQIWSRRRGSDTMGEASTSSSVKALR